MNNLLPFNFILFFLLFFCSISYAQNQVNDLLYIYPPNMGNSHIPYSTGDVYLTGFSGSGNGDFIYRVYDGSSNSEKLRITSAGYLGIGTTTPLEKLEINEGSILIPNSQWYKSKLVSGVTTRLMGINIYDDIYIGGLDAGTRDVAIRTNGQNRIQISDIGNVGIGTVNPSYKLDIVGDIRIKYGSNIYCGTGTNKSLLSTGFMNSQDYVGIHVPGNTGDGTAKFLIKSDGNIGIGITNPQYKLTVDGIISASEVRVSNTPNSDYVFEPDYNLLPLYEVETFIKENKHLPDVPSAEQFAENGVGLGEMDDMLLRKVEELTLYIIQQNKELAQQDAQLEQQSTEIASLKEQNKKLNILLEQNENQDLLILQLLKEIEKLKNNEN